jgi:UDP-N-acetylmuramyl pentapeptide phosphotransferase/UDP-N-acetylglucosamine-1-phosphate transferase
MKNFKIFLGDSGSNLLGFICGFNAIYLYELKNIHPSIIIWPLAYVVYEFLSVNIIRILYNREIFKAGSDHLHYEIKELLASKSNNTPLFLIIVVNIFFSIIGINLYYNFKPDISILLFITLFFVYLAMRFYFHKKLINK